MKSIIFGLLTLITFSNQAMVYKYECAPNTQQVVDAGVGSGTFSQIDSLVIDFSAGPKTEFVLTVRKEMVSPKETLAFTA